MSEAPGLKDLRAAEEEAALVVERARKERVQKMKQAKADADKEIAAFRAEQEAKLKEAASKSEAEAGAFNASTLKAQADKEVTQMGQEVAAKWEKVADMLMEVVTRVDLRVPIARKGVEQSKA